MEKMTCECSICLEPFETPRGLPCLHNYCTKCLQFHIDNNREGEKFTCPLCRTLTTTPDTSKPSSTWATTFPIANVVCELMGVLHIKNEKNKSSADHCEFSLDQNAHSDPVAFCKTCELNLCQNCSAVHSIGNPAHKIMLDKDSLGEGSIPQDVCAPTCPTHKNSELDLFCIKCDTYICVKCTYGRHASCSKADGMVKTIELLEEEQRSKDQIQLRKLQHGRDEMDKLLKNTEMANKNLLAKKKLNENKIDGIIDKMIASLEKKRSESKASLEQVFNARRKSLEKTSFVAQRRLKGLSKRISRLQTNFEIENSYEYLSESKKITKVVDVLLPADLKLNLTFLVDPEFRLISNKVEQIDIGNAFTAQDADYENPPWCKFETLQNLAVKVYSADIITAKVDGIVNPTDCRLIHSGKLSERITLAAGPTISAANKKVFGSYGGVDQLDFTNVYITQAGDLNFQYMLHAVVPDHEQMKTMKGGRGFENLISQTVSNSLFVANSLRLQSVALPSFCFNSKFAASCTNGYLQGVLEFSKNYCTNSTNTLREVHFVDTSLYAIHHIQNLFKNQLNVIYNMVG